MSTTPCRVWISSPRIVRRSLLFELNFIAFKEPGNECVLTGLVVFGFGHGIAEVVDGIVIRGGFNRGCRSRNVLDRKCDGEFGGFRIFISAAVVLSQAVARDSKTANRICSMRV